MWVDGATTGVMPEAIFPNSLTPKLPDAEATLQSVNPTLPCALVGEEEVPGVAEAAAEAGAAQGEFAPAHAEVAAHLAEAGDAAGAVGFGEDGVDDAAVATVKRVADAAELADPGRHEVDVDRVHELVNRVVRVGEGNLRRRGVGALGRDVGGRDGNRLAERAGLADGELAAGVDDAETGQRFQTVGQRLAGLRPEVGQLRERLQERVVGDVVHLAREGVGTVGRGEASALGVEVEFGFVTHGAVSFRFGFRGEIGRWT